MIRQKNIFQVYETVLKRKINTGQFRAYVSSISDIDYLKICCIEEFSEYLGSESLMHEIGECSDYLSTIHFLELKQNGCIIKPKFLERCDFDRLSNIFLIFVQNVTSDLRKRVSISYTYSFSTIGSYMLADITNKLKCDFYQLSIYIHGLNLLKHLGRMSVHDPVAYKYFEYPSMSLELQNMLKIMYKPIFSKSDVMINQYDQFLKDVSMGVHIW